MSTKVVFENATIQDVIGKAAKIAPTRGSAFDKAAGILVSVDANEQTITVRSTDTDVYYLEVVDVVSIEGDSVEWLLPSITLGAVCSKLPIGSNKQITWQDEGSTLKFTSGKMRGKLQLMRPEYYPVWEPFDPDGLELVSGFGGRVEMVTWAAAKGDPPTSGVHFDGEFAIATDQYRLVRVPCVADPIYKPITVPAAIFSPIARQLVDVRLAVQGEFLCMMPDDHTQIKAVIYGQDYLKTEAIFALQHTDVLKCKKGPLLEMIERASVMTGSERAPLLKVFIGKEEIACYMEQAEVGMLGDIIDVPGFAEHDYVSINFTPKNLIDAISHAPSDEIELHYHQDRTGRRPKPIKVDGGSGYTALVMPRTQQEVQAAEKESTA